VKYMGGLMNKSANKITILLVTVAILIVGAMGTVSCGGNSSGAQAAATADSAYSDLPIADLIDITVHRLGKAIEYTRLLHQDIRVTGEIGAISTDTVSILIPGDQDSSPVVLDVANTAFETLVDANSPDGFKAGSSVTVEGEFVGANKDQNPAIFVDNIIYDNATYQRAEQ
jgi:hypothetical protein